MVLRELTKEMLNWPNLEVRSIIFHSLNLRKDALMDSSHLFSSFMLFEGVGKSAEI